MNTIRTLEGSTMAEMLYPDFRKVNFGDSGAVRTVTFHIRDAWKAVPPAPENAVLEDRMRHFMLTNQKRIARNEELTVVDDLTTVDTEWRGDVYSMYNHVFADVMRFLVDVGMGVGHCHHPCHKAFGIEYPKAEGGVGGKIMKWDTHVLIIPAYLGDNVKIRLMRKKDGETKELDAFTKDTPWDIWWLKKGTEVTFSVEGGFESERKGLAAVMAVGVLCDEDDLPWQESEDEDGDEDGDGDGDGDGDEGIINEIEGLRKELDEFKEMTMTQKKEVEES